MPTCGSANIPDCLSALSGMRLLACLLVAPQRGSDEPALLSYAISSFCPTSADGLQPTPRSQAKQWFLWYLDVFGLGVTDDHFKGVQRASR
jgi:hypothetical protein